MQPPRGSGWSSKTVTSFGGGDWIVGKCRITGLGGLDGRGPVVLEQEWKFNLQLLLVYTNAQSATAVDV